MTSITSTTNKLKSTDIPHYLIKFIIRLQDLFGKLEISWLL